MMKQLYRLQNAPQNAKYIKTDLFATKVWTFNNNSEILVVSIVDHWGNWESVMS